jgi:adenylyltransferase/sulfurtransferase
VAVTVYIPTVLKQYAGGSSEVEVSAATVGEALDRLTETHSALRGHFYNERNKIRTFINIYVNDTDIRHVSGLDTPTSDGDRITIVPAIAGGSR